MSVIVIEPEELRKLIAEELDKALRAIKDYQNQGSSDSALLTVQQAADLLQVSQSTIRNYSRAGKLNPLRLGRKVCYKKEELLEALR